MNEDAKSYICPNCKVERIGLFCNVCGNELNLKRLDILNLLRDFSNRLFLLESIYWHTFLSQLKHPGIVSIAYIRGNRKKFANPLSYMISLTIVTWIVHTLLIYLGPKASSLELMLETSFINEYIGINSNNLPPKASEIFNLFFGKAVVTNIICVIPIAIFMRILFRKSGYNTAEHIVIAMYGLTFANIITVVFSLILIPFILLQWINISNVASLFNFSILILTSIYGARRMYKTGLKTVIWRVITVIFLSTFTLFLVLFLLMLLLIKITGEASL